jgi:hypothetical protein
LHFPESAENAVTAHQVAEERAMAARLELQGMLSPQVELHPAFARFQQNSNHLPPQASGNLHRNSSVGVDFLT